MRLRQLATSQSVVFFAPPEVHGSILDLRKKKYGDKVDSYDVICWLLKQTCSGIEQLQPLYFSHGADYCRRIQTALNNPDFLADASQRDTYLGELRQIEQKTLEQLYKPKLKSKAAKPSGPFSAEIAAFMNELNNRRKGFQDSGNAVHGSALQEVEQEREVAFEVEAVREVQKPVYHSPLSFPGLHKDIASFAETGRVPAGSNAYEHAFVALRRTALGLKYGITSEAIASKLYVSKEFTRTVSMLGDRPNDNFLVSRNVSFTLLDLRHICGLFYGAQTNLLLQRQVNWILWSVVTETALIIIAEEAEILLPRMSDVENTSTHLLTYAAPVTRKMAHFNTLSYYAVPALPAGWKPPTWLTTELGIFAGRLYFEFDEYSSLRTYLGLKEDSAEHLEILDDAVLSIEPHGTDGAADDTADETEMDPGVRKVQTFTAKPLTFLQEWMAVKRKGQDFTHTPMGHLCQGKLLTANHPFFSRVESNGASKADVIGVWKGAGREGGASASVDEGVASDQEAYEDDELFDDAEEVNGVYDDSEPDTGDSSSDYETESD